MSLYLSEEFWNSLVSRVIRLVRTTTIHNTKLYLSSLWLKDYAILCKPSNWMMHPADLLYLFHAAHSFHINKPQLSCETAQSTSYKISMLPLQKVFHPWLHIGLGNGSYLILASVKSFCLLRIAKEIVHFTLLCLGGLHGDLRILHLQLWNCTWQPPILTASSSFPIKAGMNTRNSIRKLPILTGGATSYIVLRFLHPLTFFLPLTMFWASPSCTQKSAMEYKSPFFPPPISVPEQDSQHWLRYFRVWNQEYWIVVQIFF